MHEASQSHTHCKSRILSSSLIDASLHPPEVLEMVNLKMSYALAEYVVQRTIGIVDYALGHPSTSTAHNTLSRSCPQKHHHTDFSKFVHHVVDKADISVAVLLVTLVYLERAKSYLSIALEEWAYERTFLGALIVADKFCNDVTLKNIHWAACSGIFDKHDVGLIEREFLAVLDFDLTVSEADLLAHYDPLMSYLQHPPHHTRIHHPRIYEIPVHAPVDSGHRAASTRASRPLRRASSMYLPPPSHSRQPEETRPPLPRRTPSSSTLPSNHRHKLPQTTESLHSGTSSTTLENISKPPSHHTSHSHSHSHGLSGALHSLKLLALPRWGDCRQGKSNSHGGKHVDKTIGDDRSMSSLSVMVSIPVS